ncbi:hypothetical protein WR25_26048 [Diploscapter pachys]|uniref:Uncharacterized protein n=1 Tax=Diploscapter pachys TaxID=2018661 RepID=A0A2A2K9G7_9BILA|nr:hypothetical protein WR25_26048 [Diploscapter pachys]
MRRTASSSRAAGIVPSFASRSVFAYSSFHFGPEYMNMSRPALIAAGQSSLLHPGTWPCAFQSPIAKPSKPIRCFSTPVSRLVLPVILTPFQLEKLGMTVSAPAARPLL